MKTKLLSLAIAAILAFTGCAHSAGQVPPGPQTYTCQTATANGTGYTPLNPASNTVNPPVSGQTYSDNAGAGTWCYIVQAWLSPNSSVPSNVAMVTTTAALPAAHLTWTNPQQTQLGVTYVVSRVAAIANSPLLAPTMSAPSAAAQLEKPALPDAKTAPTGLVAILQPERNAR